MIVVLPDEDGPNSFERSTRMIRMFPSIFISTFFIHDSPGPIPGLSECRPELFESSTTRGIDERGMRLLVDLDRPPGRLVPRISSRAVEPARAEILAQRRVRREPRHGIGQRRAVVRIHDSAASPTTSGRDDRFDVITGVPHAIASSGGRPKPS